jgi:hypothetical protein
MTFNAIQNRNIVTAHMIFSLGLALVGALSQAF